MAIPDRPCIRPGLAAAAEDRAGRTFVLWDQLRLAERQVRVTAFELEVLNLCDGSRTLRELQMEVIAWTSGQIVPLHIFESIVERMDEALFLEGERFRERAFGPVRAPACIGCYAGEPDLLRRQFHQLFTAPDSSGLPRDVRPDDGLRAALLPHIDYARGGKTYTWALKEIVERTPASLFVIIGTSHYSSHRFTLTRKNFLTPLGVVPTDQAYLDRLVSRYGDGLFDDELMAHLPEHSIELEVVLLQYLYEGKRPIRIVPLVVGSFQDAVISSRPPRDADDIGRMIEALRAVEADTPEPICYLISGDLAHIGPKFGDPKPVAKTQLWRSKQQDHALLQAAEKVDPLAYFRVVAEEEDARRICGLPPTYTLLEALRPAGGKLLHYDQYVHPKGFESVSFASMAFYR
jgi:AmmeMemoRadiSam system protein B